MIWQFIINGLITGILYSLLAIGFTLVYNTTRIFHIAAAGIYVLAAYMFWLFVAQAGLPVIPAAIIAVILTMLLSLLSEMVVYRPLKNLKASLNVAMIASIGLMTVIINTIAMFFGNETKVENSILKPFSFGNFFIFRINILKKIYNYSFIIEQPEVRPQVWLLNSQSTN